MMQLRTKIAIVYTNRNGVCRPLSIAWYPALLDVGKYTTRAIQNYGLFVQHLECVQTAIINCIVSKWLDIMEPSMDKPNMCYCEVNTSYIRHLSNWD